MVFWWVELDFFSLEFSEVSSNELGDVSGFGVTLGILYIETQGCVPVLLEICMACLALELVGPWVELNFSVCMEAFQRRQWHPTPVLLPGKPHGQRGLVGCSPWGREESDMTE